MSYCQNVKFSKCQIVKRSNCQNDKLSKCQIVKLSNLMVKSPFNGWRWYTSIFDGLVTWQNSTKECLLLLGKTQLRNAWSNYLVRLTRSFLASDRLSERSVSSSRLAPAAFEIWTIEHRQTHHLVILQIWYIFDTFLLKTSDEWCDWYEYTSINLNDDIVMKMKTYLLNKIEEKISLPDILAPENPSAPSLWGPWGDTEYPVKM